MGQSAHELAGCIFDSGLRERGGEIEEIGYMVTVTSPGLAGA